ncbi:feruloyl esterase b precursor [Stagonosporopsis vannaccii]|nr:feruloyl esterase b precursor [Stagonosporopsis vannaccii]
MAQRRTHKKSKLGCQNCKRRHIKCDEGRPACINCTTTDRQCVYVLPKPRRVQSGSATPTMDVEANVTTNSPASMFLHPISAANTVISTPSSFAASPVFTPASLLQSDTSHSINLRHLELLSNFICEVASSLDTDYSIDTGLLRGMMPAVLSKPFLLLEVLALSALHLSRTRSEHADDYFAEATSLQIEALTLFDDQLGSITSNNCEAVLMFASFLGVHSLGEAVMTSENDAGGFLDRFVTYLNLHRGVRTIVSQSWQMLLRSKIAPALHNASDRLKLAESQHQEQAVFVETELNRLLDHGDMNEESNTACRDAVARLKMIYQADYLDDQIVGSQRHAAGLIWAWPILLSGVYTDLLQKRQPEALIILCYFSVLLHRRRSLWFVDSAGRLLIEAVTKSLGSYWRHWLDWPNDMMTSLQLRLSVDPRADHYLRNMYNNAENAVQFKFQATSSSSYLYSDINMSDHSTTPASACNASGIPLPVLFGAEIINLSANSVTNFSRDVSDQLNYNHPSSAVRGVDFCNITVTYTHPGHNDTINVETWLPTKTWNGRLQAIGGGGWVPGRFFLSETGMAGAIGEGYVTTSSDAGVGATPDSWALLSPGNVNLYALQDLASVALDDQAVLAKQLIKSFYGRSAEYSYWSGCSQGGRQGLMLAQRYPDAYDGIAASAPALNWNRFVPSLAWAQVMMSIANEYPPNCEFDALTDAAIAHCDPLDGVNDGLISDVSLCSFDPFTMVGRTAHCSSTNTTVIISQAAARIANLTWTGPRKSNGDFLWHGVNYQADLTGSAKTAGRTTSDVGYASTTCTANGTCTGLPTGLGDEWLRLFIKKDPDWAYTDIESAEEFERLLLASVQQYESIIGTTDPDLSGFRDAGGKLLTFHGLADGLIPTKGTSDYYNEVNTTTSNIESFFRYFEVPGLGHCSGGSGGQPTSTFQALVDWVEKGVAPETLPIEFNDQKGVSNKRILCPYPQKAVLKEPDVDVTERESWVCA